MDLAWAIFTAVPSISRGRGVLIGVYDGWAACLGLQRPVHLAGGGYPCRGTPSAPTGRVVSSWALTAGAGSLRILTGMLWLAVRKR